MTNFAVGREAYGFCERCAFRWPIGELKAETYKGQDKHNRVCPECWDEENPQVFVGDYQFDDPQSLRRPAPDLNLDSVNSFVALNVGVYGQWIGADVGTVEVST